MSTTPKSAHANFAVALAIGLVTFAAAAWAAYPQGLAPPTVALLAGGCALVPFGLTLAFTGDKSVGAVVSCIGLLIAASSQAPSLFDQSRPAPPTAATPNSAPV